MKIGSLFSGIGGLELGLEWAGLGETVWQVEKDEYAQKVLAKHWPDVKRYEDIHDVGKHNLEPVGLICGGFPCQPFSVAGKQKGKEDDRYLWPEMVRVIEELKPAIVIGENVPGIIRMGLDQALSDLESLRYTTAAISIPACAVGAPHIRQRVFIVAYSECGGLSPKMPKNKKGSTKGTMSLTATNIQEDVADSNTKRLKECNIAAISDELGFIARGINEAGGIWQPEPSVGRVAHGIPNRVDRLKCLGNAVVPQVSYAIGCLIKEWIELEISQEEEK